MTTTVCITPLDEGAPLSDGALDPYRGLAKLLPKLKKPSWPRLIGTKKEPVKVSAMSTDAQRCQRRNQRRTDRLSRALNGEFTRSRATAA